MAAAGKKVSISGSVGRDGKNAPADVTTVQNLINEKLQACVVDPDGKVGPQTIGAIEDIQRRYLKMDLPDGKVDPHGATFRFLAGQPGWQTATSSTYVARVSAHQLVNDPRVKAFLDVLSWTEGTFDDYGKVVDGVVVESPYYPELVGQKNVSVKDLSRHPMIVVKTPFINPSTNENIRSSAAGRYQFIKETWKSLSMTDFSPASQDIAAVKLMLQTKGPVIASLLAGKLDEAVYAAAPIWASLPIRTGHSAYGGQPAKKLPQIQAKYEEALKKYPAAVAP